MSANAPEKKSLRQAMAAYFGGHDELGDEPLPEVNKALIEDAPRVVRLTIWGLIAFVVFCLLWANFAVVDEVTRGDGKAIPSSRLQKIQNLEGGIVAELFVREGQIVDAGDPLLRLDDTRFASNVGETEADRYSLETVNEPDALATALVKTAEYRYPRPSALQEALFYTHPSVEKRALMAMEWKATHPETP